MKMAQPPPDQNFYHPHPHSHPHPQLPLPPQFRNPFDLLFDERTGAINYNYIRPYIPNQIPKPDDLSDSMVMRRPRRTRTTFTSAQIAELEQHFLQGRYLTSSRLAELSAKLALGTAQVKIWFKNRRRRHKIQSDQQKEFSCDGMPLSPTVSNAVKTEPNGSTSSCGSNSSGSSSSSGGPPSLQSLSLNGSDGSTPNTLTPSPTPTTPTTNLIEHYGEPALNSYYYNHHNTTHPSHPQTHHSHASLTHPYTAASSQYYPPPPPGSLQHHQHQQQYHTPLPHQYQMQHKNQAAPIKEDPDYNFNNPYYMRMPTSLSGNSATAAVHPSTVMSPSSEVYEPITPKNDKNSTQCNGVGNSHANPVDGFNETKRKLRVLVTNNANGNVDTCNNGMSICSESSGTSVINIMDECTGAFAKFPKITSDTNDTNYQCTMDTLMHAYSNHRNNSTNPQQFATYCFN